MQENQENLYFWFILDDQVLFSITKIINYLSAIYKYNILLPIPRRGAMSGIMKKKVLSCFQKFDRLLRVLDAIFKSVFLYMISFSQKSAQFEKGCSIVRIRITLAIENLKVFDLMHRKVKHQTENQTEMYLFFQECLQIFLSKTVFQAFKSK